MILLDSGGLFAALVESELRHEEARITLDAEAGPLVLSPVVLCELDHLLLTRAGVEAEAAFLREVGQGRTSWQASIPRTSRRPWTSSSGTAIFGLASPMPPSSCSPAAIARTAS